MNGFINQKWIVVDSGFSTPPHDEQIIVKNNGRPKPKMTLLIKIGAGGKV